MIAAGILVDRRRAPEFAPDDNGNLLVQAALVQVLDERADALVEQGQVLPSAPKLSP